MENAKTDRQLAAALERITHQYVTEEMGQDIEWGLTRCTVSAEMLQDEFGGVIYGYSQEDNPSAKISEDEEGHDFLVIDGRWLVDWWASGVECLDHPKVMDLVSDAKLVRHCYGDRSKWVVTRAEREPRRARENPRKHPSDGVTFTHAPSTEEDHRTVGFESDRVVRAYKGKTLAGELFYDEGTDEYPPRIVSVEALVQHAGVGSALVRELVRYVGPYEEIEWDAMSREGLALRARLDEAHGISRMTPEKLIEHFGGEWPEGVASEEGTLHAGDRTFDDTPRRRNPPPMAVFTAPAGERVVLSDKSVAVPIKNAPGHWLAYSAAVAGSDVDMYLCLGDWESDPDGIGTIWYLGGFPNTADGLQRGSKLGIAKLVRHMSTPRASEAVASGAPRKVFDVTVRNGRHWFKGREISIDELTDLMSDPTSDFSGVIA